MRFLRYYYYRLYLYYLPQNSVPMLSTFVAIFLFAFFNGLTLLNIHSAIYPELSFEIPLAKSGWKRFIPASFFFPFIGLFMYYFQKGYHEKIMKEFEGETKKAKKISGVLVVCYFVGSMIFFFLSLELIRR